MNIFEGLGYISVYALMFFFNFLLPCCRKQQSLPASTKLLTHFDNPFSNPLQISKTTILTLKCIQEAPCDPVESYKKPPLTGIFQLISQQPIRVDTGEHRPITGKGILNWGSVSILRISK